MAGRRATRRRGAERLAVLLVDIGNTRIKWARWGDGRLGSMHAAIHAGWTRERYAQRVFAPRRSAERHGSDRLRVIVASVAGARVDGLFASAVRSRAGVDPQFLAASRRAAGVTTRYREPWRLGVDRFAAAIAAHQLAGERGVCVVNAGTTLTIDLVDARGVHRGGVILPGPQMMVASLMRDTAGIEPRARESGRRGMPASRIENPFARSTKDAIWQGALHALAASVDRASSRARSLLGESPLVVLTGGGARHLDRLIQVRHIEVPDLVLRGVALQAGLALR